MHSVLNASRLKMFSNLVIQSTVLLQNVKWESHSTVLLHLKAIQRPNSKHNLSEQRMMTL